MGAMVTVHTQAQSLTLMELAVTRCSVLLPLTSSFAVTWQQLKHSRNHTASNLRALTGAEMKDFHIYIMWLKIIQSLSMCYELFHVHNFKAVDVTFVEIFHLVPSFQYLTVHLLVEPLDYRPLFSNCLVETSIDTAEKTKNNAQA